MMICVCMSEKIPLLKINTRLREIFPDSGPRFRLRCGQFYRFYQFDRLCAAVGSNHSVIVFVHLFTMVNYFEVKDNQILNFVASFVFVLVFTKNCINYG